MISTKKLIIALSIAGLISGCKADLGKLDTTTAIHTGIGLPIGKVTITMADLLSTSSIPNLVVDEQGVFHLHDTLFFPRKDFHPIDLTQYVILTEGGRNFYLRDQIDPAYIQAGKIVGDGHTVIPLEFALSMDIDGFNEDPDDERIDSILISLAKFTSKVDIEDFGLEWRDIKSIELVFSDQVKRPGGNTIQIPISGRGFGQDIPINVDNFSVTLMAHPEQPIQPGQAVESVDSVAIKIRFNLCIAAGHEVSINTNSRFHYNLDINLLDYDAIWGFFHESSDMVDSGVISMEDLWEDWSSVENTQMRFAQPELTMAMCHYVAAPLKAHVDYLYSSKASTQEKIYAHYYDQTEWDVILENLLDPKTSAITDSVEDYIHFSYREDEGQIDELFYNCPDSFCYSYHVQIDHGRDNICPQHRICSTIAFRSIGLLDLPFMFAEGTKFTHAQDIENVNISALSLDSLLAKAKIECQTESSELSMLVKAKNFLPFDLDIAMECYDEYGLPMDISLIDGDLLRVGAYESEATSYHTMNQAEQNRLPDVKTIRIRAYLRDNHEIAILTQDSKIELTLGISANVKGQIKY